MVNLIEVQNLEPKLKKLFVEYPKIKPLRRSPNVFNGRVEVTEKIHGSNTRLMVTNKGLALGSRHRSISRAEIPNGHPFDILFSIIYNEEGLFNELLNNFKEGTMLFAELFGSQHSKHMGYQNDQPKLRFFNILTPEHRWLYTDDLIDYLPSDFIVPRLGIYDNITNEKINELLRESKLTHGDKEGIVIKRIDSHNKFGQEIWGKIVNQEFVEYKELHNPTITNKQKVSGSNAQQLADQVVTEMRMEKALQRCLEDPRFKNNIQSLPKIIKSLKKDIKAECEDELIASKNAGMKEKDFWKIVTKTTDSWYRDKTLF